METYKVNYFRAGVAETETVVAVVKSDVEKAVKSLGIRAFEIDTCMLEVDILNPADILTSKDVATFVKNSQSIQGEIIRMKLMKAGYLYDKERNQKSKSENTKS